MYQSRQTIFNIDGYKFTLVTVAQFKEQVQE